MLKVAGGGTGGGSTPGAVVYQGVWNASTNVPTLTSSVGTNGYYYVVSVAGSTNLNGITDWQVNDWAVFNGTAWQKIDNTDGVVSVNGQNGVVVLTSNDVGATANTTYVLAGTGLSGGGRLNANVTVNLANTAVTAGTYGNATNVAQIIVDAQGRITSASNVAISGGSGGSGTVTSVATGTGLTGGPITTTGTISIASTAVTAGVYGNAATVGTFTVNGQGQLTAAANAAISIPASAINTTIPNSGLTNSSVTINGTSISLGGSGTITSSTVGTLTLGTGLTGTSFNGSTAVTTNLANTAVVAGSYGNASTVGTFTVDAQGRLTAASNTAISIAVGSVSGAVPNTRLISTGTGLTGGGDLTADRTLSVTANSTQQLVGVQNNGTLAATRQIINFAPGNNAVIAVSDDSANGRANVTVGTSQAVTFTTSVTTPTVLMNGATSGTVTVKVPAVAGTTNFQLPASNGTSGYVLSTDGSGNTSWVAQSGGGGGSGLTWQSVQTANFTATANNAYPVNTTSGAVTVTLPASPSAGNVVQITDYAGTFNTNACTVNPNGGKIAGSTSNAVFALNRESIALVYIDSTQGWIFYSGLLSNALFYTASYLIAAGGGGGGGNSGGAGGAGGLLQGTTTFTPGLTYTVTVGAGGAGNVSAGTNGSVGVNSSLTSITASGGGYGGGNNNGTGGGPGGSGGGGSNSSTGAGSGTSGQGYSGGTGATSSFGGAGGGGGAGAVGGNAPGGNGSGNGGAGASSSITGSSVTYAGGGGGGAYAPSGGTAGTGGTGGGGAGASASAATGTAGTANLGGGGGGGAGGNGNGGAGGSGVVILSVPTANYSGTTTGSPTVTTSGSNTIIKFTASGSYTA